MSRALTLALSVAALVALPAAAHANDRIAELCNEISHAAPDPAADAAMCVEMLELLTSGCPAYAETLLDCIAEGQTDAQVDACMQLCVDELAAGWDAQVAAACEHIRTIEGYDKDQDACLAELRSRTSGCEGAHAEALIACLGKADTKQRVESCFSDCTMAEVLGK